jgi:hypothetical protein
VQRKQQTCNKSNKHETKATKAKWKQQKNAKKTANLAPLLLSAMPFGNFGANVWACHCLLL